VFVLGVSEAVAVVLRMAQLAGWEACVAEILPNAWDEPGAAMAPTVIQAISGVGIDVSGVAPQKLGAHGHVNERHVGVVGPRRA